MKKKEGKGGISKCGANARGKKPAWPEGRTGLLQSLMNGNFFSFLEVAHFENQGCQMIHFQTKNPILGKFWRALD
jgi:hypothetical protein